MRWLNLMKLCKVNLYEPLKLDNEKTLNKVEQVVRLAEKHK